MNNFNLSRSISVHSLSAFINIISKQVSFLVTIKVILHVLYLVENIYITFAMALYIYVCGLLGLRPFWYGPFWFAAFLDQYRGTPSPPLPIKLCRGTVMYNKLPVYCIFGHL